MDMREFISDNKIILMGALIGLLLALIFLTFGFWKTLLVLILVSLGAMVGYFVQESDILK
ncbi:DUF2273 domain-containing protein [Weissella minor]|uniref:DUF2273 domain-containing protein n=1 Tax=Weissella minor TaxID=1620 RepID=A0A0R2JI63_9LACO|nr:DUF2273 domain-containing protein [Weissella minor]KRN77017.1 hypothetical protein IV67_GL000530 [Weissella minor]